MSHLLHPRNVRSKSPDKIGIWTSSICLVHCTLPPILFAASAGWEMPHGWEALDYLFLVISFLAVWFAVKPVKKTWIKVTLWAGWVLLASGIAFEHVGVFYGHFLIYLGSATLVFAHFWNLRFKQKYKHKPLPLSGETIQAKTA